MRCARCQREVDADTDDPERKAYFVSVAETRLKYGREFFERIACAECAAGVRLFMSGGGFVALPVQPPKPESIGSAWNHRLCEGCWRKREPAREPVRVLGYEEGPCCACGAVDASGIYVREDPGRLLCQGRGPEHAR